MSRQPYDEGYSDYVHDRGYDPPSPYRILEGENAIENCRDYKEGWYDAKSDSGK